MEHRPPILNRHCHSQELLDTRRSQTEKLNPFRRQLAQALQCPTVRLCQLLQAMKLLYSCLGPVRLVQLQQVSLLQARPPLLLVLLRTTLLLQGRLRRPLITHLKSMPARDPIPSHRLAMTPRLHSSFRRALYMVHPRRRLRLKVIISDLPAFLPMSPKFFTKMVALALNLPTRD